MSRIAFGSPEISASSGTEACMRKAISCCAMVVWISGSPISAWCFLFSFASESSIRLLTCESTPLGLDRKSTGSPVVWKDVPWNFEGRKPLPQRRA